MVFNYKFTPSVVVKAEYHDVVFEDFSFTPLFPNPMGPPVFEPFNVESDSGNYIIVSFSASF